MSLTAAPLSAAPENSEPGGMIPVESGDDVDRQIEQRIEEIFSQISRFDALQATVHGGVVTLTGEVANEAQAQHALGLASRLEGVTTVEDGITRTLDLRDNLNPLVDSLRDTLRGWLRALPLLLVALTVFALVAYGGHRLAGNSRLWSRLTPNPFLADLAGQAVRVAAIACGLLLALNVLGATALMGTILGGAGVLGLAISFAVKDSMENYISSIMLSVRQPFRAQDHVVINEYEGIVIRLTSRSTVLMTLDGNHLRIPNATVFKAIILNYTRNPQRRFDFTLGVDAQDDPADAIRVGLAALCELDWILDEPQPVGIIDSVGDSNILISFLAWIDQRSTDYGKARSLSIRAAKNALETRGFTLPEPIYRVRLDQAATVPAALETPAAPPRTGGDESAATPDAAADRRATDALSVLPETHLTEKVRLERTGSTEEDLLDGSRPVE
ncbi:MAG: mechanosensitive ion channel [Halioglobus sp.]|nr:mechanosensitive ion channel [Halioglobus sp.]